jgi:Domain of unknown function (DUF397)
VDMNNPTWRKSSYSGSNGGECIEVASHHGRVLVRDTKDQDGPVLQLSPAAWRALADRVKDARLLQLVPAALADPVRGAFLSGGAPYRVPGPVSLRPSPAMGPCTRVASRLGNSRSC